MILDNIPLTSNFLGVRTIQTPDGTIVGENSDAVIIANKMEINSNTGTQAMMVKLDETDTAYGGGIRGEITLDYESDDTERWYTYEVFIPDDFQIGSIFALMQMHDEPDDGDSSRSPNFLLSTDGENIFAETGLDIPTEIAQRRLLGSTKLIKNRWVKCMLHVYWSKSTTDKKGNMEFSYNGVVVGKDFQRPTSYDDSLGAYVKFGLYDIDHNPTFGTRTAYFRNLKRCDASETYVSLMGSAPSHKNIVLVDV